MTKSSKILDRCSEIIFSVGSIAYMIFSFIEPDKMLSMQNLTIGLLALLVAKSFRDETKG
jgi:hypothetical protein